MIGEEKVQEFINISIKAQPKHAKVIFKRTLILAIYTIGFCLRIVHLENIQSVKIVENMKTDKEQCHCDQFLSITGIKYKQ